MPLVDTSQAHVNEARMAEFDTMHGKVLFDSVADHLDLSAFAYLLALTPNDEVHALAALRSRELFGQACVCQLISRSPGNGVKDLPPVTCPFATSTGAAA